MGASPSGPADFHLGALEGVVEALPLGPVDAISIGEVGATQVEAVEVGKVAAAEPEGSRGEGRAVLHKEVLVPVEGGELLAAVVGQGVAWQRGGGMGLLSQGASPKLASGGGRVECDKSDAVRGITWQPGRMGLPPQAGFCMKRSSCSSQGSLE